MNNTELLKQLRIVFVGIPDAGKSTLISNIIELEYSNGNNIYGNADTRTIKVIKILMLFNTLMITLYHLWVVG